MRQVYDGKYRFLGLHGMVGYCELKVFAHDTRHEAIVIFCEIPSNPGTSVTNAAEFLAAVVHEKVVGYRYEPEAITWVEHYPQHDTFDLIRFKITPVPPNSRRALGRLYDYSAPEWKHWNRADCEQLVGHPIEVRHLEKVGRKPA